MNCTEFENVVVAIARDEVIDAAARRAGLVHVDACARCARRLASEKMLSDAVAAAVAEDSAKGAPPRVGRMLVDALRERQIAAQRLRRTWFRRAVAGAVAAMLLIGAAAVLRKAMETPARRISAATSAVSPEDQTVAAADSAADEVTTDFIPVVYDPAPILRSSLVRVQIPREALIAFGLPMNEDRTEDFVQADFLLDENGLMRAVRFVE